MPSHLLLNAVILIERPSDDINQRSLRQFAARARRAVKLHGEFSIWITSPQELQRLNRLFRGKNKATDVLSFPSALPGSAGDVAIAREIAAANARALGHSVTTELKILILHGLLHLAGYDHESDNGEMTVRESKLRRELRLPLGLIERTELGNFEKQVPRRLKPSRDDRKKGRATAQLKLRPLKRGGRRA